MVWKNTLMQVCGWAWISLGPSHRLEIKNTPSWSPNKWALFNQQTGVLSKHLGTSRQTDPNSIGFLFSTEASGITWVVGYSDSSFRQRWKRETKRYLLGSSILGGSTPTPVLMNTVCSHAQTCTDQPAIYLHISAAKRPNSKAMWTLLNSWNMDFTPPQKKNVSWPAEMVRIWQLPTGWGPRVIITLVYDTYNL